MDDLKKSYLAGIIDSIPSILIGVDKNGKITQWNEKARQITGISRQSAQGQPFESVFPRMSNVMEMINQAIEKRKEYSDTRRAWKKDNQMFYEDITVYPLAAKEGEGAVIRIDDVTRQVRMEEMVVQSGKMLTLGGLSAGISHEITNLLAVMVQNADVIKSRLENMDMPANILAAEKIGISLTHIREFMKERGIFKMINAIHESGIRASDIVNGMLSFARKSEPKISSHYPDRLMDKAIDLALTEYNLKKQYDFKLIEIVKQYDDNLPMLVCEEAKIQQVLLNILRNGAQAMQEAKTASPRFILRIYTEKASGMICIQITDNGPGMDEQTRSKIFEPFFTTKNAGAGTGLGLFISYFIITENHKGALDVTSGVGKGTTFSIRLPDLHKKKNT